ncbi:MAG: AraC family transcriptional regulator [Pseudonocardiales bacterium]|nr:AraC family transcriptional regulator [Pseudonocardiales bacterium]
MSLDAHRRERPMHVAVRRAIGMLHDNYHEPITLTDLAAEVYVSPFHFSRLFAKATGVTPGRYLTAVRLFEAKRLLLTSDLTVSDIVCSVGYSSVGTFTSRFTRAVGMTPSQYREPQVRDLLLAIAPHFQRLPSLEALRDAGRGCAGKPRGNASITARIDLPVDQAPGNLLVGVFAETIPQCGPVAFTGLQRTRSATVTLENVPPGRWLVLAAAEHPTADGGHALSFGSLRQPVTVTGDENVPVRVRARALQPTDPPIAITLAARSERPTSPGADRAVAAARALTLAA